MDKTFIKINGWLLVFSWFYGICVKFRNRLFELGILKSRSFDIPIISVGNITAGGSGKTPCVLYLIRLLKEKFNVAVLSRGYKRKSKGYVLATKDSKIEELGDESYWLRKKHPDIHIAVDANRCNGIERIMNDYETKDTDVILLDDAYQHRYVKPGINMLLIDFHRLIIHDKLLPAGRLREPQDGKKRANIVIITKCPKDLKPMEQRVITKSMRLLPYQQIFFTTLEYEDLRPVYYGESRKLDSISEDENVLLLTGIALPEQIIYDMKPYMKNIAHLSFPDHYQFTKQDIEQINDTYRQMPYPKIVVTTEKDNTRLVGMKGLSDEVRYSIYILPVRMKFMFGQEEEFNNKIIDYVQKNSRNSGLVEGKNDNKSKDSDNIGDRPRTISFRN